MPYRVYIPPIQHSATYNIPANSTTYIEFEVTGHLGWSLRLANSGAGDISSCVIETRGDNLVGYDVFVDLGSLNHGNTKQQVSVGNAGLPYNTWRLKVVKGGGTTTLLVSFQTVVEA